MPRDRQPQGVPHSHADVVVPLLPPPPLRVVEIGCGPEGGFVPTLLARGDAAVGVDPQAPDGPAYRRVPIEDLDDPGPLDAVVAGVSLHHVADLGAVLDRVAAWLSPGGTFVVLEWAWERFDEVAARWTFDRLPDAPTPTDVHPAPADGGHGHGEHGHGGHGGGGDGEGGQEPGGWLRRHREGWRRSGVGWEAYLEGWAGRDLHRGSAILAALDARFRCDHLVDVPYFFADLQGTSAADEQAALDTGGLPPSAFLWRGRPRTG